MMLHLRWYLLVILVCLIPMVLFGQGLTLSSTLFPVHANTMNESDNGYVFSSGKYRLQTFNLAYDHSWGFGAVSLNLRWDKFKLNSQNSHITNQFAEFYEIDNLSLGIGYLIPLGKGFYYEPSVYIGAKLRSDSYWDAEPKPTYLSRVQEGVLMVVQKVHYRYALTKHLQAQAFLDLPHMVVHQVYIYQGGQESRPIGFQFILNAGVGLRYSFK